MVNTLAIPGLPLCDGRLKLADLRPAAIDHV
jgi:hypothetical protein